MPDDMDMTQRLGTDAYAPEPDGPEALFRTCEHAEACCGAWAICACGDRNAGFGEPWGVLLCDECGLWREA